MLFEPGGFGGFAGSWLTKQFCLHAFDVLFAVGELAADLFDMIRMGDGLPYMIVDGFTRFIFKPLIKIIKSCYQQLSREFIGRLL